MNSRLPAAARDSVSRAEARRIALAAQGFNGRRPRGTPDARTLRRVIGHISALQIDSVNVLVRSHYLPLFSRIGGYPTTLLDRAAARHPRQLFEYWAHAASLVPVGTQPYLRFRMARAASEAWGGIRRLAREQPALVARVRDEVRERGPIIAREIDHDAPRNHDSWGWNWSAVKTALEWLFYTGEVTAAARNGAFERIYDIPERVFPKHILDVPTPSVADAHRELVRIAARAQGIATEKCLRDYFRLKSNEVRPVISDLVEAGELVPVQVEGWNRAAFLHRDARIPSWVRARALLSPFDSLVWERSRVESLFDFAYRLEIYTPPPARVFGYYVLPFLLGDRLVARVDLKADRQQTTLRVQAAHGEASAAAANGDIAEELADELTAMADWLGLESVSVAGRGDLAAPLARVLAR